MAPKAPDEALTLWASRSEHPISHWGSEHNIPIEVVREVYSAGEEPPAVKSMLKAALCYRTAMEVKDGKDSELSAARRPTAIFVLYTRVLRPFNTVDDD